MIRDDVSRVLGVRIPVNGWERAINELSRTGAIDQRIVLQTLIILCRKIEELENAGSTGN